MTATHNQRLERQPDGIQVESAQLPDGLDVPVDTTPALPRRGLLDRDWQKALIGLLTLLAGVAVLWVVWQVVSPILHTLVLFALAAVLAFALSGPVDILSHRLANRLIAIMITYLVVGIVVVGGLTLIAGPFVRQATDLAAALPQYANDLQARAPEVQMTLGQYGIQTDIDQLKAQAAAAIEQGGSDVLKNLVGTLAEVGGMILDIVLVLVISLYLLVDGSTFRERSLAIIPAQHRAKALFLQDNVARVLGGYLRGQLTLALIIGVLAGVGTALLARLPPKSGGQQGELSLRLTGTWLPWDAGAVQSQKPREEPCST